MRSAAKILGAFYLWASLVSLGSAYTPFPTSTPHSQDKEETGKDTDKKKEKKKPLPLKAERTISFTTDEGSWLSLDVSPDGATIVFELLGDLYTIPFQGGKAASLSDGMAFDSQPRFSPDGESVLFVSDRDGSENLWLINLQSKKTKQVTQGKGNNYESPEWTPDGRYIITSKAGGGFGQSKLWMIHRDGGSGIQLIKKPDNLRTVGAAMDPEGRLVWYAQRTRTWQYNAIFPQYELGVYDRETGKRYTRSSRFGSAFRPVISPDGTWLVFGTRYEDKTALRLRELKTGEERWLAFPVQHDDQESVASRDVLPGMSFTPDSRELVASYGGKIWRIPIDGSSPENIPFTVEVKLGMGPKLHFEYPIEDTSQFTIRQIRDAVPSPDGKRLAFAALDRLYVMDYPDGTPARLTKMEITEAEPTWSPDGEWIAYTTWSPKAGHLYKVRSSGQGDPIRLTTTSGIYQQPAWAMRKPRIAVVRGPARAYREAGSQFAPGANEDIVWVAVDGGETHLVAPTNGRSHPHFTSDSERIFLYHRQDGLVSVRWDGSDEKKHVKVTGKKRPGARRTPNASLVLMAPVGDRALAQVNNDLFVVTVPYVGGETPTISVVNPKKAAFPARQLTEVGGQFPAWGAEGRKVHWSIGNAHIVYDLEAAREAELKAEAEKEAKEKEEEAAEEKAEEHAEEDKEKPAKKKPYEPDETRITIKVARDIPKGVAVLTGARVITMNGNEVIEKADIVVRNNRIEAVGRKGQVRIPSGAHPIDLSGKTIVPGFVDTHAHMRPAFNIHKTSSWAYMANLAYGVTTSRDPQTGTTDVLSYGDMVESGKMSGPRIYSTGPGVFSAENIRDLDHARNILKRYSGYYDTHTIKMYMSGTRQQRQWIIMAAKEQKLMPTTEGGLDLKYNLEMLIDGYPGQEHSFPIYPLYKDVIQTVAESGITYTPTLIVSYGGPFGENYFYTRENPHNDSKLRHFTPHQELDRRTRRRGQGVGPGPGGWFMEEEYVFKDHAAAVKDIVEAGGRTGVGSHGQLQGLGYHWELWMMQSGGLSRHDALRVATMFGASAIGLGKDLGSLEAGKLADLIVLEKNPLDDIRNTNSIRYVMKNGRLYEGDTLDELWPRKRQAEGIYWLNDDPNTKAGIRTSTTTNDNR